MASAEFAGDAAGFFAASGWRQFFLNEHFTIAPPYNSLAELCDVRPKNLAGIHFSNLFDPSSKEKLQPHLTDFN